MFVAGLGRVLLQAVKPGWLFFLLQAECRLGIIAAAATAATDAAAAERKELGHVLCIAAAHAAV